MFPFNNMSIENESTEIKHMIVEKIRITDELMRQSKDALNIGLLNDAEKYANEALKQANPRGSGLPSILATREYDEKYLDIKKHLEEVQNLRIKLCK